MMKLPGVAWVALVMALTGALGGWLTQYVQEPWVPIVVLLLSSVAKIIEMYFSNKNTAPMGYRDVATVRPTTMVTKEQPSKVARFFLG